MPAAAHHYYPLTCGHYGCRETNEKYHAWRISRKLHYCEICDGWKLSRKPPKVVYPNEPMF